MRKLKLQIQISIDGYIADSKGHTDWMVWNWGNDWTWDKALQNKFIELKSSVDTFLLSRNMAEEGFIGHWTRIAEQKRNPQSAFARYIAEAKKVVFTKTLKISNWENTVLAKGDLAEEVNQLKRQKGKDLIVYGGASFVTSLIEAGLIDEFHLYVNPVALGKGKTIFENSRGKVGLKLTNATSFDCGMVVLEYVPDNK